MINEANTLDLDDLDDLDDQEPNDDDLITEEEAEIIKEMETDPSKSGILIERNLRLVVYIAKKFENTGIGIEDLISIGTIGLKRSIVICNRLRPVPKKSKNCLGL